MRQHTVVRGALLCAALVVGVGGAQAQTPPTEYQRWSVDSADTVGDGANVVRAQVAWPGLWLDFVHGLDSTFDIGGRLAMNWGGVAGEVNYCASFDGYSACGGTSLSFDFQLLLRKQIAKIGPYKIALTFNPGFIVYTTGGLVGMNVPIGAQMGIPFNDKLIFNASFELPMYATFGTGGTFVIPILFGGGAEYAVQRNLLLTFKLAMGPSIPTHQFASVSFALEALLGVAYKL
ncbi:MAG: hypothetical protein ACLQDQ_09045 [Myxococcaceae bacterium]